MKRFLGWASLCVMLGIGIGVAVGQTGTTIMSVLTGNELVSVIPTSPFPTGGNQSVFATTMRDAQGYSKQVPVTGATVTVPNNTSRLMVQPAGGLSTLTVDFPAGPTSGNHVVDGFEFCLWSTQNITTLTMQQSPNVTGETVNNGLTSWSTSSNTNGPCWAYSASNKTWDRSQ